MLITIRRETEQDYFAAENCCRNAFWNVYSQGCYEHFLIHSMRTHKDFIPELSFVLEYGKEIIGGIFYTRSSIIRSESPPVPAITFAPVFIEPKFQRQGFGKKLILHSIQKARQLGYSAILILGSPKEYAPYGFCGAKKYRISMPDGLYYQSLLALPLQENALSGVAGYVQFSNVFEINNQDAEIFDKNFPPKEKRILPSQKEFEKACSLPDDTEY